MVVDNVKDRIRPKSTEQDIRCDLGSRHYYTGEFRIKTIDCGHEIPYIFHCFLLSLVFRNGASIEA